MANPTLTLEENTVVVIQFDKNGEAFKGHVVEAGTLYPMENEVQLDPAKMEGKSIDLVGIKAFEIVLGKDAKGALAYWYHTRGCRLVCR